MDPEQKLISSTIIPAIMPKDYQDLDFKAGMIHGAVPRAQIDIMDGIFVPSLSWPFKKPSHGIGLHDNIKAGEGRIEDHLDTHFRQMQDQTKGLPFWEELDYDVDLMVENPAKAVDEWAKVGINRVILHVRDHNMNDIGVAIEVAKEYSLEISLAVLPGPISEKLTSFIFDKHLKDISGIQCMGIAEVGYQGKPFAHSVFDTIHQVRRALGEHNEKMKADGGEIKELEISVDGGVTPENARPLYDAGVDKLVSGHDIFDADSPRQEIEFFEEVLG